MSIYSSLLVRFTVLLGLLLNFYTYSFSSAPHHTEYERVTYRLHGKGPEPEYPFQVEGLSGKEEDHTWTQGYNVLFTLPASYTNKRLCSITFRNVSALIGRNYDQSVEVFINGESTRDYLFTEDSPSKNILIPLSSEDDKPTTLRFYLPNACTPSRVYPTNNDPRLLGLVLRTVDILFEISTSPKFSTINLGAADISPLHPVFGFADGEGSHRWLEGNRAQFTFPTEINARRIAAITFDTFGMVSNKLTQKLLVSGRGIQSKEFLYDVKNPNQRVKIDLPEGMTCLSQINFEMPNACLPSIVDPRNADPRELSIAIRTATLLYAPDQEKARPEVPPQVPPVSPPKTPPQLPRFIPPAKWMHNITSNGLIYYNVVNYLGIIGADKLQNIAKGKGSTVIVIESGVDKDHPQLAKNFSNTTLQDAMPKEDHGTHVCGIIQSIAPEALLDVISTTVKGFGQALILASFHPADVVNISLTFGCVNDNDVVIPYSVVSGLESVVRSGKAVVISFGNDWNNLSLPKDYAVNYSKRLIELTKQQSLMGRVRIVTNLQYAEPLYEAFCASSNRSVEPCAYAISAPGTMILSAMPGKKQAFMSGTSMAAPMVSGSISLLMSAIPGLTIDQALWLMDHTARRFNRAGAALDYTYGLGILDVWSAYQLYPMVRH